MHPLTPTEGKALLLLFKDFSSDYNANTLAKKLNITRRGALKIVKHLYQQGHLLSRTYGKAVFYKINLEKAYTKQLLKVLLMGEAEQKAARWQYQFRDLLFLAEAAILFGSLVQDEKKAKDIDLVLIIKREDLAKAQELIHKENRILLKPIHPIWQSSEDFIRNLQKPDPVLLNALRRGYVLQGYDVIISAVFAAQQAYGHFAIPEPEVR